MERYERMKEYLLANGEQIIEDTISLVRCQSPTENKEYTEKCADAIELLVKKRLGIDPVQVFPQENRGRHLYYRVGQGRKIALMLGHFDTVWDIDQLPLKRVGDRLSGPGTFDMKYGIVAGIWAVKALHETGGLDGELGLFFNSDEEMGSRTSRGCIETIAKDYENALILEGSPEGVVAVGRKSLGAFDIKVHGVAAHAGADYKKGRSAILEAAHLTQELFALTDLDKGSTVNVGVIKGGTKSNVFASYTEMKVDIRVTNAAEGERLCRAIHSLQPHQDGITLEITGGINRPPFEFNEKNQKLYAKALEAAKELGGDLPCAIRGGGSDGNFTSFIGIPTLDSMGPVGNGAHAESEHMRIEASLHHTAVLANLLTKL